MYSLPIPRPVSNKPGNWKAIHVEVLQNLPIIIVLEFHTTKRNTRQVRDKATLVYHLTTVFFFTENQRTGGRKQETEGALSDY